MKILLLTNLFTPFTRGGAERIAELQADLLARAGHEVLVVAPTPDPSFSESLLVSGARVVRFRPRNLYFSLQDTFQPLWKRALWHLIDLYHSHPKQLVWNILKQECPDLVITHNMKGFGLRAFEALRESGVPHIHVLHDLQLIVPSGLKLYGKEKSWQVSGFLQRRYVRATSRRLGSPTLVISPSQYLLDEHRALGFFSKSRIRVLPNPAPWDVAKLGSGLEFGHLDKSPNSRPDPMILYVGQLEEHKGLRILMDAWQTLCKQSPENFHLGIVGSGGLEHEVEVFAKENSSVTCYGRKSPSEVHALMSKARLVVVPSLCYENAPTVIMEALSLGTPIVAWNIGGIPELIGEGEGTLVEPGNPGALHEAIKKELAKSLGREKIKISAERFSLERYQEKFLGLVGTLRPKG